jgi:hypothetical protein
MSAEVPGGGGGFGPRVARKPWVPMPSVKVPETWPRWLMP